MLRPPSTGRAPADGVGCLVAIATIACAGGAPDGAGKEGAPAAGVAGAEEAAPNTLTAAARADGWRLLFDGESFDGWRGIGRDGVPAGHWIVEDGAIHKLESGEVPTAADGQPLEGGDLMTIETFDSFEIAFEWRVAQGANSGGALFGK